MVERGQRDPLGEAEAFPAEMAGVLRPGRKAQGLVRHRHGSATLRREKQGGLSHPRPPQIQAAPGCHGEGA